MTNHRYGYEPPIDSSGYEQRQKTRTSCPSCGAAITPEQDTQIRGQEQKRNESIKERIRVTGLSPEEREREGLKPKFDFEKFKEQQPGQQPSPFGPRGNYDEINKQLAGKGLGKIVIKDGMDWTQGQKFIYYVDADGKYHNLSGKSAGWMGAGENKQEIPQIPGITVPDENGWQIEMGGQSGKIGQYHRDHRYREDIQKTRQQNPETQEIESYLRDSTKTGTLHSDEAGIRQRGIDLRAKYGDDLQGYLNQNRLQPGQQKPFPTDDLWDRKRKDGMTINSGSSDARWDWVWNGTEWKQKFVPATGGSGGSVMGAQSPGPAPTEPGTVIGQSSTRQQKLLPIDDLHRRQKQDTGFYQGPSVGEQKKGAIWGVPKKGKIPEKTNMWTTGNSSGWTDENRKQQRSYHPIGRQPGNLPSINRRNLPDKKKFPDLYNRKQDDINFAVTR